MPRGRACLGVCVAGQCISGGHACMRGCACPGGMHVGGGGGVCVPRGQACTGVHACHAPPPPVDRQTPVKT